MNYSNIHAVDSEIYALIEDETAYQNRNIQLIPSENYCSEAVMEALSTPFMHRYSEGYPSKRYYGGQVNTDKIERLCIDRACKLYNCRYANVQCLSGAMANWAVYLALLQPGDTILGMDLSHGGHLTHGHPKTHTAQIFTFKHYKTDMITGEIDYDGMEKEALLHHPKLIIAGFSSYTRHVNWSKIKSIADKIGAYTMADISHISGLIAAKVLDNPIDSGFDVMTTTTHKSLRGPRGAIILTANSKEIASKVDKSVFPGMQGGPHMHQIAAKAVAFYEALQPSFYEYSKQIIYNAKAMERAFKERQISIIWHQTDNHMLLINTMDNFNLSGSDAEKRLEQHDIIVNKNVVPDDIRSALDPSGIRLGTPAMTSKGYTEDDFYKLTMRIIDILEQ